MNQNRPAIYHRVRKLGDGSHGGVISKECQVGCAVAVVVTHQQKVLFGQRIMPGGGFEWQLPGGWINVGEQPRQAACREVHEETGLELRNLHYIGVTSNVFSPGHHSISLYFEAECVNRDSLIVAQPEKCHDWVWRSWSDVTDNLFLPLRLLRRTGYRPFKTRGQRTYVAI